VNLRASGHLAVIAALVLLLGGCAGLPLSGHKGAASGASAPFEMQGRVFVRSGRRAFSGSIRWRHEATVDELWLGGPVGQSAAHIVRDPQGASLTTVDGQTYRSMSLDGLMQNALGWTLPVADLSHYVRGAIPPQVAESSITRDERGRVSSLAHDGWVVELTATSQSRPAASSMRPARLRLRKDDVEVRIVIDQLDAIAG
jgi:outer membrane lipoprotein LolB